MTLHQALAGLPGAVNHPPALSHDMQLIRVLARRHGVDREEARAIFWRQCISPRVRLTVALFGWAAPDGARELRRILRGFGRCRSYADAESDMMFYAKQRADRGMSVRSMLFSFRPRRLLRVASRYLREDA